MDDTDQWDPEPPRGSFFRTMAGNTGLNPFSPMPPQPAQPAVPQTISRDSTSSSSYQQQQLAALQQPWKGSQYPNYYYSPPPPPPTDHPTDIQPLSRTPSPGPDYYPAPSDAAQQDQAARLAHARRNSASFPQRSQSARPSNAKQTEANVPLLTPSSGHANRTRRVKRSVRVDRPNPGPGLTEDTAPWELAQQDPDQRIAMLEKKLEKLRGGITDDAVPQLEAMVSHQVAGSGFGGGGSSREKIGQWKMLYRIPEGVRKPRKPLYLCEPEWMQAEHGTELKASMPLKDLNRYLDRHPEISFVVFKEYEYSSLEDAKEAQPDDYDSDDGDDPDVLPPPRPSKESILFTSDTMLDAIEDLTSMYPSFHKVFPDLNFEEEIQAPYLFLYYMYPQMIQGHITARLSSAAQEQIALLNRFMGTTYLPMYQNVISAMDRGVLRADQIPFLVKPGDVIVTLAPELQAHIVEGWLVEYHEGSPEMEKKLRSSARPGGGGSGGGGGGLDAVIGGPPNKGNHDATAFGLKIEKFLEAMANPSEADSDSGERQGLVHYAVSGWRWDNRNDGIVGTQKQDFWISAPRGGTAFTIARHSWFPLRYATPEVVEKLVNRGKRFLGLWRRQFVGYSEDAAGEGLEVTHERYLVDFATYKKLHHENPHGVPMAHYHYYYPGQTAPEFVSLETLEKSISAGTTTRTGSSSVANNDARLLVFPSIVTGYNLRLKRWEDVSVDQIREVDWNKKAFENLVIDNDTKHLVKALISNQIKAEKGTDLISGKGNGLIILLHGGPGTGKTFTAESVAELAEKPLYRVTCGDIGTKPEEVEKYLESVFYLGQIWGCVVLLDEADVFLEERSLTDLQRNALVSVFLRALEYYDGILILTSNRVGIFDQAFKSRIQLALHYENLTKPQRRKIWRNFFNRLKDLGEENVDYDDLYDHIDDLAEEEMNGRQIRNAITTARQLSQFDEKNFSYDQLKHVIRVAGRFEGYLKSINQGYSDDQLARDNGIR
ncbi:hypothetical protein B0H66DRAFT_570194 [Apodospora peruviana]|uniref:AAA+ ATPase domain-containing protein n=1 Tax=Apodospora peruviana TaxID=516989 RepID=A0AAE0HSQ4_9PEZI|nr:hypothetical protein B0H66DRAFT_570194 [Apodospora peruviana]